MPHTQASTYTHTHTHTHTSYIYPRTPKPRPHHRHKHTNSADSRCTDTQPHVQHSRNWLTYWNTDGLMVVCVCTGRDTQRQNPAKASSKRPVDKDMSSHQHLHTQHSQTHGQSRSHTALHGSRPPRRGGCRWEEPAEPVVPPDFPTAAGLAWLWGGNMWP